MPEEQMYIEVVGSSSKVATELTSLEQKLMGIQSKFISAASAAGVFNKSMKGGSAEGATKMSTSIRQIASAITKLTTAAPSLSGALDTMVQGLNNMPEVRANAVKSLTAISSAFKGLGVSLKNTVTYAGQTGDALTALVNSANGLPRLNANAKKTLSLLSNLAPTATRASKGMTNLGASMDRMGRSASKSGSGLFYMLRMAKRYITTGIFIHMFSKLTSMFGESIKKTMEWTETVNFFNVAYGSLAETAGKFYQTLADTLGLDISTLANDAAIFTQMSKSLGFTNDEAYKLSRNLIMIGLDLASLTDSSFEETSAALRSGVLGGQYKPLATRYGINVQAAVLQETAEREGITEKVKNMTALEKAYLRYKTVLWGARIAQGDFTKTLESPINQLRVFKSATESLSRAFGSIFIPVIGKILPYVIAFTKCMQQAIASMGIFMGYLGEDWKNTTDIDMTGLDDDLAGIGDTAGGSSAAIAELKKNIMGFDQFNILKDNSKDSGGGAGSVATGGASFKMDWGDDWDLMLEQLQGNKVSEIMDNITKVMKPLSDAFGKLFGAVKDVLPSFKALWDDVLAPLGLLVIGSGLPAVVNWLGDVAQWFADHPKTATDLLKLMLAIKAASTIATIGLTIKATMTGLGLLAPAILGSGAAAAIPVGLSGAFAATGMTLLGTLTVAALTAAAAWVVGDLIIENQIGGEDPVVKTDELGYDVTFFEEAMNQAARKNIDYLYDQLSSGELSFVEETYLQKIFNDHWGDESVKMINFDEAAQAQQMKGGIGGSSFGMPFEVKQILGKQSLADLLKPKTQSEINKDNSLSSTSLGQSEGAWSESAKAFHQSAVKMQEEAKKSGLKVVEEVGAIPKGANGKLKLYDDIVNQKMSIAASDMKRETQVGIDAVNGSYNGMPYSVQQRLSAMNSVVDTQATLGATALNSRVGEGISAVDSSFSAMPNAVSGRLDGVNSVINSQASVGATSLRDRISEGVSGANGSLDGLGSRMSGTSLSLATEAMRGRDAIVSVYADMANSITRVLQVMYNNVKVAMSGVVDVMALLPRNLSIAGVLNAKNAIASSQLQQLPMFSGGGFPEDGLFAANHGELLGKFSNGKTAVANNVQIIEGIKYGVAEGVSLAVNANGGSGGGNDYETVYRAMRDAIKDLSVEATPMIVDGDTIGEVAVRFINKKTRSSGASPLKAGA